MKKSDPKDEEGPEFKGRFKRLRTQFKRRPEAALRTLTADIDEMEGLHSKARCDEFVVESDEPIGLFGTNLAPTPTQLFLSALAHCQAITLKIYANGLGVDLEDVKVKVTGLLDLRGYFSVPDKKGRPVESCLEDVVLKVDILSQEPKDRILDLIRISQGKGICLASVRTKNPVRTSYRLNGKKVKLPKG